MNIAHLLKKNKGQIGVEIVIAIGIAILLIGLFSQREKKEVAEPIFSPYERTEETREAPYQLEYGVGLLKGYDPYWIPNQPRKNK